MPLLEFWPQQPHHLLVADGRTIKAGGTFEASKEDAEELLGNPEIRVPQGSPETSIAAARATDEQKPDKADESEKPEASEKRDELQPQTHSPGRAERSITTDRRP